jgi:sugar phosphate isomerase/epimerase
MRKLSVSEITTDRWAFEEDVLGYKRAGVKGIGVWWNKLRAYGVEKGIALLKTEELPVSSLIGTGWFTLDDKSHLRPCIDDPKQAIDLAARLGADCLAVVAGPPARYTKKEALKIATDAIAELVPVAEQKGVRLALEPLHPMNTGGGSVVNTLSMALDIVEAIDSPCLGLFVDVYHVWWDYDLDVLIPRAKGRIFGVHVNDWREPPRSTNRDRAMIGEGIIPLKHILGLIEETGYQGFYEVEILSEELWNIDHNELLGRCICGFEAVWD